MPPDRIYTTQLQAGLGMVSETLDLLRLWQPGDIPARLAEKAVREGLFSRATARRARNITAEMFAPRYLTDGGQVAIRIKRLIQRGLPQAALNQIFFLHTARAQAVFRDFVVEVYWPKYSAGATIVTKADAERFIHRGLDTGLMKKRWTESTIRRVSGYLMGCCVDFGLLGGKRSNERPIQRFVLRSEMALYLAHDLHFRGCSDMGMVSHPDWRLFGHEPSEVVGLLKTMSQGGHLLVQSSADLVQVSWIYPTMEACLDALTQR